MSHLEDIGVLQESFPDRIISSCWYPDFAAPLCRINSCALLVVELSEVRVVYAKKLATLKHKRLKLEDVCRKYRYKNNKKQLVAYRYC